MLMIVSDLIEQLQELPPDLEIIMSKDAEGNRFSPLSDIDQQRYRAESTYEGSMLHEVDKDYYGEDWDEMVENSIPAVFFWPVN
jgi:hypothetical protein